MRGKDEHQMSAVVVRVAERLIEWEAKKYRLKEPAARDRVAKDAGIAPGSLRRLKEGTLKNVDRIGRKLDGLFLAVAEQQIAALKHEMALAKARGDADHSIDVDAFDAALTAARQALRGRDAVSVDPALAGFEVPMIGGD